MPPSRHAIRARAAGTQRLAAAIAASDRVPGCFVRIRELLPRLSETEQRICREILADPRRIILESVVELAERSQASEASVVRLCRKLGYAGFAEFKILLSQDLVTPLENIHEDMAAGDDTATIMKKVTQSNHRALTDTLQVLDAGSVERAIDLLDRAERLHFYGMGGSGAIALDAQHKFLRTGKPCSALTDKHLMLIEGALLSKADLVVAVSHSGSNRDLLEVCEVVKGAGGRLVTITHFAASPITKLADVALFTSARETSYRHESLSSRIATLNIVDILYVGFGLRNDARMVANLRRIRKVILGTRI